MPVSGTVARDNTDAEGDRLPINELFASLQGKGRLTDVPSTFVRTSDCDLCCWFCDSFHISREPTHTWLSFSEIVAGVESLSPEHVIITGGEPLIRDETGALLSAPDDDYHLTIETNGTLEANAPVDLASISLKLASSTPTPGSAPDGVDPGIWTEQHENARTNLGALASLVEGATKFQLKFVVTDRNDLDEIKSLVDDMCGATDREIRDNDVLLIPEGQAHEQLVHTRTEVADLAASFDYRYMPRLHVDLWNNAPET